MTQGITRITHAAFAIAFFGLAATGTLIYFHKHWIPHAGLVHDGFAILMIVSGVVYFAHEFLTNGFRRIFFSGAEAGGVVPMIAYYLRLRSESPAYSGYNPLQKLAYTAVLFIIAPLIVASGAALFFHVRAASVWHVGFAIEIVAFFVGHMAMVVATGSLRPFPRLGNARPQSRQNETPSQFAPDRAA
jgi:thiosulfate reductase cytochrome b subunit